MNMKHNAQRCLLALLLIGLAAPTWSEEPADNWEKVVFHVDETANARWALMLARSYLDDRPEAKIVLVAYGPGIDFLLEDAEDKRGWFAITNCGERHYQTEVAARKAAACVFPWVTAD